MKETRSINGAAYERPAVEILEFAVECGFEGSTGDNMTGESDNGTLTDGGSW